MEERLKELIEQSQRILVTTHISPDPDAVSSALLLSEALKTNFPDKSVRVVIEEEPDGLDFISGYESINFGSLNEALQNEEYQLLILVDANNYERVSRQNGEEIREFIKSKKNSLKTVIIDHHQAHDKDETDVYINKGFLAAAQSVYDVLFSTLEMKKPGRWAETTMVGLYADTGGFAYHDEHHDKTFKLASELVDGGADIEFIKNRLSRYSEDAVKVIGELAKNVSGEEDYSYSFLPDSFIEKWHQDKKKLAAISKGSNIFVDGFIRNINDRNWGFVLYKDALGNSSDYHISLRSLGQTRDVSVIAHKLGGGGHKPAAGAKFEADSLDDALGKVTKIIRETA